MKLVGLCIGSVSTLIEIDYHVMKFAKSRHSGSMSEQWPGSPIWTIAKLCSLGRVLTAAAVTFFLSYLTWPSGPSYVSKSINSWFTHRGRNDAVAFRAMGHEAVPFLIRRLENAPSECVESLLGKLSTQQKDIYRQRTQMSQVWAAYLLGEIGGAANSAETHLAKAAANGDWSLRGAARVALMKIRRQPLDPLIEQLSDASDCQAWYENAMMVGQFGARAEPAIPILLTALQHSNSVIRAHALIALGMIARQPERCVPAIARFLTSPNVGERQGAMGVLLLDFGKNAEPARRAIQGALNDSDPYVRSYAERAMNILAKSGTPKSRVETTEPLLSPRD